MGDNAEKRGKHGGNSEYGETKRGVRGLGNGLETSEIHHAISPYFSLWPSGEKWELTAPSLRSPNKSACFGFLAQEFPCFGQKPKKKSHFPPTFPELSHFEGMVPVKFRKGIFLALGFGWSFGDNTGTRAPMGTHVVAARPMQLEAWAP